MPGRARHPGGGTASGALGDDDDLARLERGTPQAVLALQPPDPLPWIAAVVLRRDRPEAVARAHSVRLPGSGSLGAPRQHGPGEDGDQEGDKEDANEHVFGMLANVCSVRQAES